MPPRPLAQSPRKVFDGFGFCQRSVSAFVQPRSVEDVAAVLSRASEEGIRLGMRGSGRSYGDAALNGGGLILDMRHMGRVLSWNAQRGVIEAEPGLTIRELWTRTLADGWWPPVVSGTAWPTLGGCVAMNIHGKNHFRMGGISDHVLELDLITPGGEHVTLSPTRDPELFFAVLGGFGMLGVVTRIKLQLKRVYSGRLKVQQFHTPTLQSQLERFEQHTQDSDYLVSWVDCITSGGGLGRAQIHRATYLHEGEDPEGVAMLEPARQDLPGHIMGVPKSVVPKLLKLFSFNLGMQAVNLLKYAAAVVGSTKPYLQGHAAFHFLLDYVPEFRQSYAPGGFIQYQPFVPKEVALPVLTEILRRTQRAGIVSYLGVLKRYRPDRVLLPHALDGYSLAMDFPVTAANKADLWRLCGELSDVVTEAGGRFYPAKDSVLRPQDVQRAWGQDRLSRFAALRRRADPRGVLRTEWAERVGLDVFDR